MNSKILYLFISFLFLAVILFNKNNQASNVSTRNICGFNAKVGDWFYNKEKLVSYDIKRQFKFIESEIRDSATMDFSKSKVDSLIFKAEMNYYKEENDSLACFYIEQAMRCVEQESKDYAILLHLWCKYACDLSTDEAILKGEVALQSLKQFGLKQEYATCLSILAYCYSLKSISRYDFNSKKAVSYSLEVLEILKSQAHGVLYASILSRLSGVYISAGKCSDAIEIADKCIMYMDSCLSTMNQYTISYLRCCNAYSHALHNKAKALLNAGRYVDCLSYFRMNLQFRLNTWGRNIRYALSVYNLAEIEGELGYNKDAVIHYTEYYNILNKLNKLTSEENIYLMCLMLDLELKQGELFNARRRFSTLLSLVDKFNFKNHSMLYSKFLSMAIKYWYYLGNYPTAFSYWEKSFEHNWGSCIDNDIHVRSLLSFGHDSLSYVMANISQVITDDLYGSSHFQSIQNLPNVLKSALAINNLEVADSCAVRYLYEMRKQIGQFFPIMTTEQRRLFLEKIQGDLFQYLPSFFNLTRRDGYTKSLFDLTLLHKGLLLRTEQALSDLVANCNDKEIIDLYHDISDISAQLISEKDLDRKDSISNLLQQQLLLLQRLTPKFNDVIVNFDSSWEDVKLSLRKDELAIEFIDIIDHNTGNKSCKALLLTSDCECPYYVDLFNESDLRMIDKDDYYSTYYLYALIWDPIINSALIKNNVKTVYFSTSALISQIAIESLLDYSGRLVSEDRNFYRISSARELVNKNNIKKKGIKEKAVVYGGLNYDANVNKLVKTKGDAMNESHLISKSHFNVAYDYARNLNRSSISFLPASKIEAEYIVSALNQKGIETVLYEDADGTEKSFNNLSNSDINLLHISTHGFYWTKTELDSLISMRDFTLSRYGIDLKSSVEDKALTRSGLFLSGANQTLRTPIMFGDSFDGILTAYEISKVRFENLDLVVLSACNSGLGDIDSGEGVLGLQRGFKKAGAKSILMTLWSVDDNATHELMMKFYDELLNGESKTKSLWRAQQHVKSLYGYESPEYWAGFVLLDAFD